MFKIKIESEIQKVKEKNIDKGNQLIDQANQLLLQQSNDEKVVIENIGINKSLIEATNERTATHLERKELEKKTGDNVFTTEEIKTMCIKYRLKFLNANKYVGKIPADLGARIVALKKKHNLNISASENSDAGRFFIMAPPSCFKLREAEALNIKIDPVMFYQIIPGLYIMVHRWGKDFTYWRRWLGIMMENTHRVSTLRFTLFLCSFFLLFTFILSATYEYITTENSKWPVNLLFIIAAVGIVLTVRQSIFATSDNAGSTEGWDLDESTWRKVKIYL